MSAAGVQIYVKRNRDTYHASTANADGFDLSATRAALKCAEAHFGVPAAQIELVPEGEHTLRATVLRPEAARGHLLRIAALAAAATLAALALVAWIGGAL